MKHFLIIIFSTLSISVFAQNLPTDEAERAKQARQTERRIALEHGKIEANMPQINMLLKKGEKAQAKAMVDEALRQIEAIEADQKLLSQLDETADEETLMLAETQDAKQYLTSKANMLRNAIGLYISCEADLFGSGYAALADEIKGGLADAGMSFTDSAEVSDWVVTISAKAREHNKADFGGISNYFVCVDAKITIDRTASGKRVYQDMISEKGGHTQSYERAAQETYRYLAPRISGIIREQTAK